MTTDKPLSAEELEEIREGGEICCQCYGKGQYCEVTNDSGSSRMIDCEQCGAIGYVWQREHITRLLSEIDRLRAHLNEEAARKLRELPRLESLAGTIATVEADRELLPSGSVIQVAERVIRHLRAEIDRLQVSEKRIGLAKDALVDTGYFKADEVSDDVAPRIIELNTHYEEEIDRLNAERDSVRDAALEEVAVHMESLYQWNIAKEIRSLKSTPKEK